MKKTILSIIIISCIAFGIMLRDSVMAQNPTFRKSYDVTIFDIAGGMVEAASGDFLFAGGGIQAILTDIDDTGVVQWSKEYNSGFVGNFYDLKKVSTGGYILCGSSSSDGAVLTRIDVSGNLIWSKQYEYPDGGGETSSEYAYAVIETSDGGFLVGGGVDYFWDGATVYDTASAMAFKTDASGNLLWNKVWPMTNLTKPDEHYFNDVAESSDGYIFVGESADESQAYDSDGDLPRDALLIKTNKTGTTQYIRRWGNGNTASEGINSAITLVTGANAGRILLGGYDDTDAFMIVLEGTGGSPTFPSFNRSIYDGGFFPDAYILTEVMENPDGNYSFLGTQLEFFAMGLNTMITKLNSSSGSVIFSKSYAPIGLSSLLPKGGIASDGGYFTSQLDQQMTGFNFNVLRTDANGDIGVSATGCTTSNVSPSASGYSPTLSTPVSAEFTSMTASVTTPAIITVTPTETVHCVDCSISPTAGAAPTVICAGASTTLSAAGGGTGATYSWVSNPAGFTSTAQNPTVTPAGTTTYTVTVTSKAGCSGSDDIIVTVNALPTATATNNGPVCIGSPLTLTGGNAGMTSYSWTGPNGFTSSSQSPSVSGSATPAMAGTYTLVISNGTCSNTATTVVTVNALPTATATNNGPVCVGTSLDLTGGNGGMTSYTWTGPNGFSSSSQSPNVSGSATTAMSGTYTLVISDGTCSNTATTVVTVNALPTATATNNGPVCEGTALNLTGGNAGMTSYTWTGPNGFSSSSQSPSVSGSATPAMAGTYTLVISDGTCSNTATTVVTVNALPTATATNNGPVCAGTSLDLTGGNAGMTSYNWTGPNGFSNSTQSPNVSGSATTAMSGTYTLTISDGTCTNTASTVVTVNALPMATATNNGPVCIGNSLDLTGGANGMTSYSWIGPNGFTSSSQSPNVSGSATLIMSGTYTLTISDGTCTNTASTAVTVYTFPTATATSNGPVCEGTSLSLTGGDPGMVSYTWTGPNGFSSSSQSPNVSASATTAMAGTYTLVISDGSCTNTATTVVTVNTLPTATATNNGPVCAGTSLDLTGGNAGMTSYSWTGPNGFSSSSQSPNVSGNATPAMSGTYTLVISDGTCSNTATTVVTVNALPTATATNNGPVCEGTALNLTGGNAGMTSYTWTGPNGFSSSSQSPSVSGSATPAMAGTYTLVISDGTCSNTATTVVTVNALPTATATNNGPVCAGTSLDLTGGDPGMTSYNWTGPNGFSNSTQSPNVSGSATTAMSGTYTLTISDGTCTNTASTVVTVNALPTATASNNGPVCIGNSLDLTGGANGMTSYSWTGPGGFTSSSQSPNVSGSATPAMAGTYILTISDGTCSNTANTVVTINTLPNPNLGADVGTCAGQGVTLNASGGGTYAWSPATGLSCTTCASPVASPSDTTTYTVTVTGANSCTASEAITVNVYSTPPADAGADADICIGSSTTLNASGAGAGGSYAWSPSTGLSATNVANPDADPTSTITYTVTVTDALGCSATDDVTVNVNLLPNADAGSNDTICPGGSTTLNASGGTIFSWSPATSLSDPDIFNPVASPTVNTTYVVTVTDNNGCSNTDDVSVIINTPSADAGLDATICFGSTTNLSATGGGTGGSYSWNPTAGLSAANIYNPVASPAATTTYVVTTTNSYGCTATDDVVVTVNQLPTADAGTDATICFGVPANLNATGAGIGGSYLWSPGTGLSDTIINNPVANPGVTTVYTVTVTDASGCTDSDDITVTVDAAPVANAGADQAVCLGETAVLTATGGSIYSWNTGDTTATVSYAPSVTTTYVVTVSYANGCSSTDDVVITVNYFPTVTLSCDPEDFAYVGQIITFTALPEGLQEYNFYIDTTLVYSGTNNVYQTNDITDGQVVSVTVSDNGCESELDTLIVDINPIPNAFTPYDVNGKNDIFVKGLDLTIFNRWGQLLFEGENGWDGKYNGKLVSSGTYFYIIRIKDMDNSIREIHGSVTVVNNQ
jgi:gliding motility-associated-like protein